MTIKSFVFNAFYENTYLLIGEKKETYIVDPGCYSPHERNELVHFIEQNQLKPIAIINTHCHIDHVLGNAFVKEKFQIPLWIPEGEAETLRAVEVYAPNWGITGFQRADVDKTITEKEVLTLGSEILEILFAPGHAPGHLMFYNKSTSTLIAGDVIFNGSIGRSDLPGGDFDTLKSSILKQVYSLPDETKIYPGHGDMTTVLKEKTTNPFVRL